MHDDRLGRWRPTSGAFKDPRMSVDRAEIVETVLDAGAEFTLQNGAAVVQLMTHDCRAMSFEVVAVPEDANPAHAEVVGEKSRGSVNRALRDLAVVVVVANPSQNY